MTDQGVTESRITTLEISCKNPESESDYPIDTESEISAQYKAIFYIFTFLLIFY